MEKQDTDIISMSTMTNKETGVKACVLHVGAKDPSVIVTELRNHGLKVEQRAR